MDFSLSQLSTTMARPARQKPLAMRNSAHVTALGAIAMIRITADATAANTAKVRIWPTRRTTNGVAKQLATKPIQ